MESKILDVLKSTIEAIPFNRVLGLTLDEVADTHITMVFSMLPELVGNYMYGILHGGVISTVLDMAGGAAAMAAAVKKREHKSLEEIGVILARSSTINLNINYIHPGKGTSFIAKAYVTHSGSKISFTNMELHNQESDLIANATATYRIG